MRPTHPEYRVELQPDGWPLGVSDTEKRAAEAAIIDYLHKHGERTLTDAHKALGYAAREGMLDLPAFKSASLLDWRFCYVERALRAAGAERCYRLPL